MCLPQPLQVMRTVLLPPICAISLWKSLVHTESRWSIRIVSSSTSGIWIRHRDGETLRPPLGTLPGLWNRRTARAARRIRDASELIQDHVAAIAAAPIGPQGHIDVHAALFNIEVVPTQAEPSRRPPSLTPYSATPPRSHLSSDESHAAAARCHPRHGGVSTIPPAGDSTDPDTETGS